MTLQTPLYPLHLENNAKMVEFGGYLLPLSYPMGIIKEHQVVREKSGLFDVSHMARFMVDGHNALHYLNKLLTNDFSQMKTGDIKYTLMCNEQGGIIDDLIVYKLEDEHYLLVCNASNHDKDLEWLNSHIIDDVAINDITEQTGHVALQGPDSTHILSQCVDPSLLPQKYYSQKNHVTIGDIHCLISRNGYTGEDGYELICAKCDVPKLYQLLLDKGTTPCGLGARDTLRLEAGMPLYGHEMSEDINPLEARLGAFVKMNKEYFIGQEALREHSLTKRRVGLKLLERGIAREGSLIYLNDELVGHITSGTQLISVGYAGAMGFIQNEHSSIDTKVEIEVRNKRLAAVIIQLPFYQRKVQK
ncbi:MAG: glycine cleavage system aminomethyltransferase GcvT [Erysipelothrix sp.]|nr:glycine cleavage system aminomethyltransferase GcvT [Erysipelothrix sp.]